ncbi:hypothetical protein [Paenibacillus sp. MMO-58]|uniref:hypothetical protein n=1 Tax=Paenibacillus sp. MMO-58 TaxID=3081290 RepID=UPI00301902E1
MPGVTKEHAPILTIVKVKSKQTIDIGTGKITNHEESEEIGILDRRAFLNVLNNTNRGLASPELLRRLNEYETLIYLEESSVHDEKWEKATTDKVRIENLLIREILHGYKRLVMKLDIEDNHSITMLDEYYN